MRPDKDIKKPAELSNSPTANSTGTTTDQAAELAREQAYVLVLYDRLDAKRATVANRLEATHRGPTTETDQASSERQSFHELYAGEASRLNTVEHGLCFGRLNFADDNVLYIGRIGLHDDDYEPLLVDWRAPAAVPFYRATPVERHGVVLRRHLHTRGRQVTAIDDDVLDMAAIDESDLPHLSGEAALLASLGRGRTGRMSDIVATIQSEQDAVIRSEAKGVLVVEGGPGTGKTVVALHRAAYLLYTYRAQLEKRGILVIGPGSTFVRYIDRVIPSLGETEVVLATLASLFPGVVATGTDSPEAAAIKGDPRMSDVIASAVANRQQVPEEPVSIKIAGEAYVVTPDMCERARAAARRVRDPEHGGPWTHNRQRPTFVRAILDALTAQAMERRDAEFFETEDIADLRAELRAEPAVVNVIDELWPELTPEALLHGLLTNPARIDAAAPGLGAAERAALLRTCDESLWSPSDVPLLDEAAELLGPLDAEIFAASHDEARRAAQRAEDEHYATEVVDELRESGEIMVRDFEVEAVARQVAGSYDDAGPYRPLAERAPEDREWTYGHVIVDEAQELSAMAWRMLMRRCPARSMTVVGDVAQCSTPGGTTSWAASLDTYAPGRWRSARLTLNYRTPTQVMAVAADVLAALDPGLDPPVSVRAAEDRPWAHRTTPERFDADLRAIVEQEQDADGRLAVIVGEAAPEWLRQRVGEALPQAATDGAARLDSPVAIFGARECKGLEFDVVIVVEPAAIIDGSERGLADLYVALTRATRRLGVVHLGELPTALSRLQQRRTGVV